MKKKIYEFLELMLYYIAIFFILKECLVPIIELTSTGFTSLFLVFIALALVLNLLRVHFLLSGAIKLIYMLWFTAYVYAKESLFSEQARTFLENELQVNTMAIFGRDFGQVTDAFRTILFFILIWMLVYLIHHWITVRMTIFYFFIMTVFFIATLDTFSPYDGTTAIVRVVVIGFLMNGLLYVKRLSVQTTEINNFSIYGKFIVPLLVIMGAFSAVAIFLPKAEPIWPDPVPYIKAVTGQDGTGGVSKVGYGENDSQLGGAFVADDTEVFTAWAPERQYWRVESKDTYTSKGWVQSSVDDSGFSREEGEPFDLNMPIGPVEDESSVMIEMETLYPFIVQPYGTYSATTDLNIENMRFVRSNSTGKVATFSADEETKLEKYEVIFREPTYSLTALRATEFDSSMYEEELQRYTQLPATLPTRVVDLVNEITEDKSSVYEKARAIEGYFARAGFKYDTKDIAVPTEHQDYVDQFLFETKIGYCDNFSTSMVVMLRSIGIPARWVKGFAPGEQGQLVDDMREFTVTNNNAHSWVEAYLPGVGWMPFEPTIGFSGVNDIDFDLEMSEQEREELQPEELQQLEEQEQQKEQPADTDLQENKTSLGEKWQAVVDWIKGHQSLLTWLFIAILAIAISLYTIRRKWLPKVYVSMYRKKGIDYSNFDSAYKVLLKQLALCGLKRQQGETLASFANTVDRQFVTDDMRKLTTAYEVFVYSSNPENVEFEKLKESWEYLINRTTG